jgi:hypothetical protein
MTTSDHFLPRRGQAWPPIGAPAAVCATAERVSSRPKVPRRYTAGGYGRSRVPSMGAANAFGRDPIAGYIQREALRRYSRVDQRGHG